MFGWGYVKDFCVSLFQKEQQEKATNIYVAECLRIISENTGKLAGGSYVQAKLIDILEPKPIETRSAQEIIDGIREKLKQPGKWVKHEFT